MKSVAVIIGSGVAGLASAIRLAAQEFNVTVFEKNDYAGGKLSALNLNGFHFDSGPSLFVAPENIKEIFDLADEKIEDYLEYQPIDIASKYFFEDGTTITAWTNAEKLAQEVAEKTGEQPGNITGYLKRSKELYDNLGSIYLSGLRYKRNFFFNAGLAKLIRNVRSEYVFQTLNSLNTSSFTKPHTVQLFNRYATYNGSDPYKMPAMFTMLPHLEFNQGVYYPKGGMMGITDALYKLARKLDVQFVFNTSVDRIIHNEGEVKGIVSDHKNVYADIVVSDADIYCTYKFLLRDDIKANKLMKHERSSSAIVFYWGIKKTFPQLDLHNIFFSNDYKSEFDHIFRLKKVYHDPTVYINITAKYDKKHAPEGKENWFVMINVPPNTGQDWNKYKQIYRSSIISKLSRILKTDIESLIEEEQMMDPISLEAHSGSFMGAIYGASSNTKRSAFLRHPNFSKHIHGLYFVGGTVHPGGGIPLCLKSAAIMSNIVAENAKHFHKTH